MAYKSSNETVYNKKVSGILRIYRESVKNVPILRYSWILIATICILALAAFFKLNNRDVFLYALAVIGISFLGFLFSYLLKIQDRFIRFLLRVLVSCIVITIGIAVLGFGSFIIWKQPEFYTKWFPSQLYNKIDTIQQKRINIEPTKPLFDTTLLEKKSSLFHNATFVKKPAEIAKSTIKIVHVRDTVIDDLPCKYFTILNSSKHSVVINKCAVEIFGYLPYLSIPESRVIEPIAIWDIILPHKSGYYEYEPTHPILIAQEDAITIGVRFSHKIGNKRANPNKIALYYYRVVFLTSDGQKATSEEYRGF